ncbi:MAG TPA: EAL domain-containing protein [Candidatus Nitrosotalea sp.]|nr:EAL domain-containing protein [Candidatus Nitrosotalea sp.]
MSADELNRELAFAGQRVKQKVIFALTLASVIPLLILTYAFQAPVRTILGPIGQYTEAFTMPALLIFTGLLMAGGGFVVWDVASAISRAAHLANATKLADLPAVPTRKDEIGTLMTSFAKMLATIEQQTDEINQFPRRLDQLARQAFRDSLTSMPNRALFMDRLSHALTRTERRGEQLAVLFLDLDRFKVVNDSMGHRVGDQLLIGVSQRLAACLRPEDTIARLGGDEFAILLEDVKDDKGPTSVADRLTGELQQPFKVEGREVVITVSIGIAMSTARRMTPEDILRDADLAMYHAKGKGKARYEVFDKSMNAPAQERMDLELDLRNAVARGEFTLHYQPVVELPTGRITEVEALVRWKHPQRGLLFPADFVALSEETGLIVPLGRWVLHEACRQTRQWQLASPAARLAISVNISARQLQQPGLVEEIGAVLRDTRLDPATLRLEITETVVMHDAPTTLAKLEALKALGVQLAIDDFGTGYSSLGYLKRFPVDTLKIDRSFVKGIGGNVEDSAIVRAVITVAKSLNLSVTAEGIETAEQLEHLRALGCDHGQGYFFAKPMTSDRVPALLLATSPWSTRHSETVSSTNGHATTNGH